MCYFAFLTGNYINFIEHYARIFPIYAPTYVTGPGKTGYICTQILYHFSNFNLMLLYTYLCYLNETFRTFFKFISNYIKLA